MSRGRPEIVCGGKEFYYKGEDRHGEGQKLSKEARNFTVKARKVTAKARNILCEVQQFVLMGHRIFALHYISISGGQWSLQWSRLIDTRNHSAIRDTT